MKLNMRPGAVGRVAHATPFLECTSAMLGMVVRVHELAQPTSITEVAREMLMGPSWLLHGLVHCARCGYPFHILPDAILKPFDPESEPGEEDNEGADPDIKVPAGVQVLTTSEGIAHG